MFSLVTILGFCNTSDLLLSLLGFSGRWSQLFDELDTDGSGYLTVDEILAIFPQDDQHIKPSDDVVRSWIANFDANNDGQLSREEFLEVIRRRTT